MPAGYVVVLAFVIALLAVAFKIKDYLVEFKEYERAVVFRFGRFNRVAGPGWVLILPVIEKYTKYDLRTHTVDVPPQMVITKDGIELRIDAVVYIRVIDPKKAELFVEEDYRFAVEEFIKGKIRNIIGRMELSDVYGRITDLNEILCESARNISQNWGVEIEDVELQGVQPPADVVDALKAQEIAERQKLAAIERAEALKIKIDAIQKSAGQLNDKALAYLYMQSLEKIAAGPANKIIFPLEFTKLAERLVSGKKD
ncbi:MAG: SPFH domain-containing protein [archaeon]